MTIKQIRRWAAAVAAICLLTLFLPLYGMTAFAATARIAFSDPTASVGSEINVKMKITSSDNLSTADIMLAYDPGSLEFIEGTNAEGGNGAVRVHGDGGGANTTTLAYDLKFKASAAGTSKITVTSQEIYDASSQIVTVDKQGESQVTVSALSSASKDASLKSLQVSPGSLTPEFSSDVDSYAVTVGTDVDKLIISADTTDEGASKVVSGNENLQMGENRVTLKVTAQDGETTKEYVIVVTKQEGGPNESTQDGTGEESFEQFQMTVSRRSFTVMAPDGISQNSNDNSVVIRLVNGNNSFMFMGDAEETSEQDMISTGMNLDCDVLSVGHHGSASSTTWDFLEATSPSYAVISCGINNQYNHPSADTMERLSDMGIPVFRTDKQGTIIAVSDGTNISWSQEPCDDYSSGDSTVNASAGGAGGNSWQEETTTSDPVPEQEESNNADLGTMVWIPATGEKYHSIPNCGRMNPDTARQVSRSEAEAMGYGPCSKCY